MAVKWGFLDSIFGEAVGRHERDEKRNDGRSLMELRFSTSLKNHKRISIKESQRMVKEAKSQSFPALAREQNGVK